MKHILQVATPRRLIQQYHPYSLDYHQGSLSQFVGLLFLAVTRTVGFTLLGPDFESAFMFIIWYYCHLLLFTNCDILTIHHVIVWYVMVIYFVVGTGNLY